MPETPTCQKCGSKAIEPRYEIPLCRRCRQAMIGHRIPDGILAIALLILVGLALALVRLPRLVEGGAAYQRGLAYEKAGEDEAAAKSYAAALRFFPDDTTVLAHLAIAYHRAGDDDDAQPILYRLVGRTMSGDLKQALGLCQKEINDRRASAQPAQDNAH
ncbi:MAG TPA: tetratricopeptide repeat protein [Chthonomonadaceae bacterium]|nr:tetratricopeptide repeat protein [Chthonomonadaceae bacterium]